MKRNFALGFLLAAVAAIPAAAFAQQPGSTGSLPFANVQQTPTTSPYLNLFNAAPGNSVYHNIVRPEVAARDSALRQQGQLDQLQKQVNTGRATNGPGNLDNNRIRPTGFAPQFQNLSHYYTASPAYRTRQ